MVAVAWPAEERWSHINRWPQTYQGRAVHRRPEHKAARVLLGSTGQRPPTECSGNAPKLTERKHRGVLREEQAGETRQTERIKEGCKNSGSFWITKSRIHFLCATFFFLYHARNRRKAIQFLKHHQCMIIWSLYVYIYYSNITLEISYSLNFQKYMFTQ